MASSSTTAVPASSRAVLLLFTLPGALFGWMAWWFGDRIGLRLTDMPLSTTGVMAILIGGGTYMLTVYEGRWPRAALVGLSVAVLIGGLFYTGLHQELGSEDGMVLLVLLAFGTVGVLIPYLKAFTGGGGLADYRRLYSEAWNNPAVVAISLGFMGVGYLLAWLVAGLFDFIGLDVLTELLGTGWFNAIILGALLGTGACIVRQREQAVLAFRGISFALIRTLSPIFAAAAAIFLAGVMVRGFGSIIEGLSPVVTLAVTAAIAIVMINAVVAEEGEPVKALPTAAARALGLMLVFLVALAGYGLWIRIGAEGLTPNRIAAIVAVGILAGYAPLYAVSALAGQWGVLRMGNIVLSLMLVGVAVFLQTPLFKPLTWSAESQAQLLLAAPEKADAEDLWYLRYRLGEPGSTAFERVVASNADLATLSSSIQQPTEARPVPPNPAFESPSELEQAIRAGAVTIYPNPEALTKTMRDALSRSLGRREFEQMVIAVQKEGVFVTWAWREDYFLSFHEDLTGTYSYGETTELKTNAVGWHAFAERLAAEGMTYEVRQVQVPEAPGLPVTSFKDSWILVEDEPVAPAPLP
ncbi:DUF4153 domain-containing protein [Parvularcula maris]|uniref:DUF4153 domain-containing protein n=1 Tax=Parvularcula maris TaxID=2965077 RepID=A0A9X2RG93_9PROT|nr:DUF4153 domain-containing protein [Parvularcula maris]MCQ8183764.1 DUF4153 domain-containing protein [Parvularcula maris]